METIKYYDYRKRISDYIIDSPDEVESIVKKFQEEESFDFDNETLDYLCKSVGREIANLEKAEKISFDTEEERLLAINKANTQWSKLVKAEEYLSRLYYETIISTKRYDVVYKTIESFSVSFFPNLLKMFKNSTEELAIFISFLQRKCKYGQEEISKKYIAQLMAILADDGTIDYIKKSTIFGAKAIYNNLSKELTQTNSVFTPKTIVKSHKATSSTVVTEELKELFEYGKSYLIADEFEDDIPMPSENVQKTYMSIIENILEEMKDSGEITEDEANNIFTNQEAFEDFLKNKILGSDCFDNWKKMSFENKMEIYRDIEKPQYINYKVEFDVNDIPKIWIGQIIENLKIDFSDTDKSFNDDFDLNAIDENIKAEYNNYREEITSKSKRT